MTAKELQSLAPGAPAGVCQRLVWAYGERTVDVVISTPQDATE